MRGRGVARRAVVDDDDPAPGPAEHERGAQTGRAAADDRDVIGLGVHALQRGPPACVERKGSLPFPGIAGSVAPWRDRRRSRTCWPRSGPGCGACGNGAGVTLTALAARTGISKSTLSRLESGRAQAEPRAAAAAGRGLSSAARRARRRTAGRRPAGAAQAPHPQRAARLSAHGAVQRHGGVEGRHPARARAQAPDPCGLRVAVRALRRDAPDPRRARHHDAARRGRRVRHAAAALVRPGRRRAGRDPQRARQPR